MTLEAIRVVLVVSLSSLREKGILVATAAAAPPPASAGRVALAVAVAPDTGVAAKHQCNREQSTTGTSHSTMHNSMSMSNKNKKSQYHQSCNIEEEHEKETGDVHGVEC